MMATSTEPRAWIGSLAAYNGGRLIGAWIDLDGLDAEEATEAAKAAMLEQRDTWPAGMTEAECFDELWVMDHEGIGALVVGECNISTAVEAAALLASIDEGERPAFLAYAEYEGAQYATEDGFRDAYAGEASSEEEYAEQLADDGGLLDRMPDDLRGYFDWAAYTRDLFLTDFFSVDNPDSTGLFIFRRI